MNDRVFGVHCSNGFCEFDSHTTTKIYKIMKEKEKCLLNRIIINETVDTIIDSIYEKTEHYMFETGRYTETNDEFFKDQVEYMHEVIKELNNRINK